MKFRTHVFEKREYESFRRFIAANGGRVVCAGHETKDDVFVCWVDGDDRIDVTDFPTWRMI